MSTLIIVGASARAAAASALRAGLKPWCADLFADADLRAMVSNAVRCPIEHYPSRLLEILQSAPDAPWIYTGGLENHPKLLRNMAEARPLWGNGPDALRWARSPFSVARILRNAGLPALEVRAGVARLPDRCRWLRKPLAGSAGLGIEFADRSHVPCRSHYFQEFVEGTSMSANFVRTCGETRLLGVTEQLIGEPWLNSPPFRYAGNIGPVELPSEARTQLSRIGVAIGDGCGLRGLFGIDFVLNERQSWVVEVNPRYTASIEVLELAAGMSALHEHRLEFASSCVLPRNADWGPVVGKAILYADRRFVFPGTPAMDCPDMRFADIPAAGEVIQPGWPILTLLVRTQSAMECREKLSAEAERALMRWTTKHVS
jgi:predicted ATP-grasp superfamily ATP-dependent carboligase